MKKMLIFMLAMVMVLGCAVIAKASTTVQMQDGDNVMELPWSGDGEMVCTYTATQTGTLYITNTEFYYSFQGGAYNDNSEYMSDWEGMIFTINGQSLQYLYYGSIQVEKGQTYTFRWKEKYHGDFGWKAVINLAYTDAAQPRQGSAEAPVKLHPQDCPTDTVRIEAGQIAYYQLWDFSGAVLNVHGENAYVVMTTLNLDTAEMVTQRYEAENGVVTAPIPTVLLTIQIGNAGSEAAVFHLSYTYPEGSRMNPKEVVAGKNVALTKREDYDGYYFVWTSRCPGKLVLTFPTTGWVYTVQNQTTGQRFETVVYGDANASNVLELDVALGDEIWIIVNSFDRRTLTVPGGEVTFVASGAVDHVYKEPVVSHQPTNCKDMATRASTCKACGYERVETFVGPHQTDVVFAGEAPTCTQNGTLPYWHCACCDTYFADEALTQETTLEALSIPMLAHEYAVSATTAGNCVTKSTTTYTCAGCGHSYCEEGALDATQHGASESCNVAEATCTVAGYTGDTCCVDCGAVLQAGTAIAAKGHSYTCIETTPGTCVEKSSSTYACSECADRYIEVGALDSQKHGEMEQKNAADATCIAAGYTGDTCCADCGKVIEAGTVIVAKGHHLECTNVVVGTCVITSSSTYTCSVCNYCYIETGTLDENNHVHTQIKGALDATCVLDGHSGNQVCNDCGTTLVEGQVIPAIGHCYGEWITTDDGRYKSRVCDICGYEETEDMGCQHTNTHVANTVEATCTTPGYTGDTCCVECGKVMQAGSGIPAEGHQYICTDTTSGTCVEKSTSTYTCSVCADQYMEAGALNADQHGQTELKNAADATCVTSGYTGDTCCVDCGKVLEAGTTIAALGHDLECTKTVAGTCVTKSSSTYTCTVCGYSYMETGKLDDTNHVNFQIKDAVDATCVIDGYTGNQMCADCGVLLVEGQVVVAKGHKFGEWTTTEDDRYRSRICATCGHKETEDLGCQHSKTQVTGAVQATCTTAGYTGDTCCADCGKVMQAGSGIPAKGHDYVCTATTPGSCTEKATSTYACSVCHYSYTEIGELNTQLHGQTELQNASDATCTENGYTGDMFCVECGQLVTAGESVQAIGHSFGQWTITQAPTATENGTQKRSCAICGTEETEEIPATGELPTEPTEPVEPSEPTTPSVPETEPTELPTTPGEPAVSSSPTATQPAPNGGEEEGTPVMTIVIIAVAVLAIAVVAVVVLKKKK